MKKKYTITKTIFKINIGKYYFEFGKVNKETDDISVIKKWL